LNIKALARRDDIEGLLEAATYQDFTPSSPGAMGDDGIQVRAEAIVALGEIAPNRARHAIRAGLHDPADQVRCASVQVLSALGEVGPLAQALRWLPGEGRSYALALNALAELSASVNPSAVADALVHREDDETLDERAAELIPALLEQEGPDVFDDVLELLLVALGDERWVVVDRSTGLLVGLAPASVEALVRELGTGSSPAMAAYVLGRIADPRSLHALVTALRHADPEVRSESAAALAELRDPAAVKPLLRATRDPEHRVRAQAGAALDRLGNAAVIVGVASLMQPMVDEAVRSAIGRPEVETGGNSPRLLPAARTQSRAHRSNGGTHGPPNSRSTGRHTAP
jgi:HEAT repeat protein